ncbi:MAG: acetyl-CoA C-acetyltransferase [Anaerolineae bacterium]|nr:acetyl-CoA C-acetyltransferase [Anaerolineae bacterium]
MLHRDDVVLAGPTRTPIGRFQGTLKDLSATQLGAIVIREALRRAGVDPQQVDEVLMGQVLQAGAGQAPARQASIGAGLPETIGATTINKVCGSGLKTVMLGAAMIRSGEAQVIVAGGMESMDQAPYLLPKARFGYRMGSAELVDGMIHDGLWCSFTNQHMGMAAEWIADTFGIGREEMDAFALESHRRAIAASERGAFEQEIVPIPVPQRRGDPLIFAVDECPRRDTSLEKLAKLSPAFTAEGQVTAGNSSSIADGAAAVVVLSRAKAQELGCTPIARIVGYAQAAVPPLEIFTAPIYAIQKVLQRTGLTLDEIDLFELNEAFASQMLANIQALKLDPARVNVNGGAIALGHPIGASGTRVLVTLLHALRERGLCRGLCSLCLGGGEAVAMIVELEPEG